MRARRATQRFIAASLAISRIFACRAFGPSCQPRVSSPWTGSTAKSCLDLPDAAEAGRTRIASAMFKAWWVPFIRFGVIHGDPHLGNYTVFGPRGEPNEAQGINLLDYGCVRIFTPTFVGGVVELYEGLLHNDFDRTFHAYETWGFQGLTRDLADILNIWARFIYAPLLDDRVRTVADGVAPGKYGRKRGLSGASGAEAKGPGPGAARIRLHGSRGDRPRRRLPASWRAV